MLYICMMCVCGFVCYGMQCKGHRMTLGSQFLSYHFVLLRNQTLVVSLSVWTVNGFTR